MNSEEFKLHLQETLNGAVTLQVYFIMKTINGNIIKLADIDNGQSLSDLRNLYINKIKDDIISNEQLTIIELSATDDRTNAIYHYDLDEVPDELLIFYNFDISKKYEKFSFNVFCKYFLQKVASNFSIVLQLHFP